jgi:hypothetical protein
MTKEPKDDKRAGDDKRTIKKSDPERSGSGHPSRPPAGFVIARLDRAIQKGRIKINPVYAPLVRELRFASVASKQGHMPILK